MANSYGLPTWDTDDPSSSFTPDPNMPSTQREPDDLPPSPSAPPAHAPFPSPSDPPAWGMITGQILSRQHEFTANRREFTMGKGANVDVRLAVPAPFENLVSRLACSIQWNGWGVPGWGKEVFLRADQHGDGADEGKREAAAFTIVNRGTNEIFVGLDNLVTLRKDEAAPLMDGAYVQLARDERIAQLRADKENLRFHFFSPRNPRRFQPQDNFTTTYTLGDKLSNGQFGTVFRAVHKRNRRTYAVKRIEKMLVAEGEGTNDEEAKIEMEKIERESEILRIVEDHENIVKIHGTFNSPTHYYIVMDLIEGGELFNKIVESANHISEADIWYYMKQLISGMAFVHRKGVAHRDLKPENIMMTRGAQPILKIVDFGLAKVAEMSSSATLGGAGGLRTDVGTAMYKAPEVGEVARRIRRRQRGKKDSGSGQLTYDTKADAWSIGIIMFVMFARMYPWPSHIVEDQHFTPSVETMEWYHLNENQPSPLAMDFMRRLLRDDPRRRMSVIEAETHAWLKLPPVGHSFYLPSSSVPTPSEQEVTEALDLVNAAIEEGPREEEEEYYTDLPSLPSGPSGPPQFVPDSQPLESYDSYGYSESSQDVHMADFPDDDDDVGDVTGMDEGGEGEERTGMSQFLNWPSTSGFVAPALPPPFEPTGASCSGFPAQLPTTPSTPTTTDLSDSSSSSFGTGLRSASFTSITPPADDSELARLATGGSVASSFVLQMPGGLPTSRGPIQSFYNSGTLTPRPTKRSADISFSPLEVDVESGVLPKSPDDEEMLTPGPSPTTRRTPVRSSERLRAKRAVQQAGLRIPAGGVGDGSPVRVRNGGRFVSSKF